MLKLKMQVQPEMLLQNGCGVLERNGMQLCDVLL